MASRLWYLLDPVACLSLSLTLILSIHLLLLPRSMVSTIIMIIVTLTRETQWFRCCGGASRATCYIERLYWTADGSRIIKGKFGLSSEGGSSGAGWLASISSNCAVIFFIFLSFVIIVLWKPAIVLLLGVQVRSNPRSTSGNSVAFFYLLCPLNFCLRVWQCYNLANLPSKCLVCKMWLLSFSEQLVNLKQGLSVECESTCDIMVNWW